MIDAIENTVRKSANVIRAAPKIFTRPKKLNTSEIDYDELEGAKQYVKSIPLSVYNSLAERDVELSGVGSIATEKSKSVLRSVSCAVNDYGTLLRQHEDNVNEVLDTDINRMANAGYAVKIVDVSKSKNAAQYVDSLAKAMKTCKLCWDPEEGKDKVEGHLLDMKEGGEYVMFIEKDGSPRVFNRFFVLNGEDGKKELFWDSMEGQDIGRYSLNCWKKDERLGEFALSIYGFVALAKSQGCERAYFAESETEEFLKSFLGIRLKGTDESSLMPFKMEHGSKVGITPPEYGESDDSKKRPYFYRLRTLRNERMYLPLSVDTTESKQKADVIVEKARKFMGGKVGKTTHKKIVNLRRALIGQTELLRLQNVPHENYVDFIQSMYQ